MHEMQLNMGDALLEPMRSLPPGIRASGSASPQRRFNIYRNNVIVGLCRSLKDSFPVIAQLVGDQFFDAMAAAFVREYLPSSPMLFAYGESFPAFIETFHPASGLPYLPGVARLEFACIEAYYSAEAERFDPQVLLGLSPREQSALHFEMHPSVRVVQSRFPILTIWRMHAAGSIDLAVELPMDGEDTLVVRPDTRVHAYPLQEGAAILAQELRRGSCLLQAVEAAASACSAFSLEAALALLFMAGAISGIHSPEGVSLASRLS
jgi:hypothetical protein